MPGCAKETEIDRTPTWRYAGGKRVNNVHVVFISAEIQFCE